MATPLVLLLLVGLLALAVYMLMQAMAVVDKPKPAEITSKPSEPSEPKESSSDS
jgi:hypothetical protein